MTARPFLTSAAVAQALGLVSAEAFLARRATLEAAPLLFPPPMPHCKRPLLWRADEVDGWISRHGIPATAGIDPALIATGKVALLDMARTA